MIYVYIFIPLIFIGLFVWNSIRGNKNLKRLKKYSNNPNISKIAIWIDLDSINGQKTDYTNSYWKSVKSETSHSNYDVVVLLIEAGEYDIVASSKSNAGYKKVPLKVNVKTGVTYQLSCNDEGVYFIEDSDPNRYNL